MVRNVTIARIYLSEADHGRHKNLMEEVVASLRDQHRVRGVTVFRGIAGFDGAGTFHAADVLRFTVDLPLVVEFFDEPEIVEAVLAKLHDLIHGHPVVSWTARLNLDDQTVDS